MAERQGVFLTGVETSELDAGTPYGQRRFYHQVTQRLITATQKQNILQQSREIKLRNKQVVLQREQQIREIQFNQYRKRVIRNWINGAITRRVRRHWTQQYLDDMEVQFKDRQREYYDQLASVPRQVREEQHEQFKSRYRTYRNICFCGDYSGTQPAK